MFPSFSVIKNFPLSTIDSDHGLLKPSFIFDKLISAKAFEVKNYEILVQLMVRTQEYQRLENIFDIISGQSLMSLFIEESTKNSNDIGLNTSPVTSTTFILCFFKNEVNSIGLISLS